MLICFEAGERYSFSGTAPLGPKSEMLACHCSTALSGESELFFSGREPK